MRIGKFSEVTGISAYTLRFYEKKGLIRVKRDEAGRRNYEESEIEWVRFLQKLKDTGMRLRDMKRYSDLRYQGDDTIKDRMEILREHRAFVIEEQKRWSEYLENLEEKIEIYQTKLRKS